MLWSQTRPINPSGHRFVGFPESDGVSALLDSILRVGCAPLELAVHRHVRYSPPDPHAEDHWATGGLMNADGELIPLVRNRTEHQEFLLGISAPVAEEPRETYTEDVLYLGWLFDAFGHLMMESLARAWALSVVPSSTRVLFHRRPDIAPSPEVLDWLEAFGISRDRIIIPGGPAIFHSLLIPDPSILICTMVHERAGEAYRAVARKFAGDGPLSDQPVYLSRGNLPSTQRAIAGEAAFEAVLRDNGFLIVHPETMTPAQQIRLMTSHGVFAVCKGGAAELLLFARPGARCHVFAARHLLDVNVLVSEAAGLRATYHNALAWRGHPFAARRLDLDAAIAGLAEDGLLPNLSRLPYLPNDAELDADFDELWLFGMLTRHFALDDETIALANPVIAALRPTAWPAFVALAATMPDERLSPGQADALMALFAHALEQEPDANRRFRHAAQVRHLAERALPRCSPGTRERAARAIEILLP